MTDKLNVLVDGLVFQKDPYGGIGRLFREILPRMCEIEPGLMVTIFTDGLVQQELPQHSQIRNLYLPPVRPSFRPTGFWRPLLHPFRRLGSVTWNYVRSLWLRNTLEPGSSGIWHSTYYTVPQRWSGYQVVTVHDLIHELFRDIYNDPLDDVARQQKEKSITQADALICVSEATQRDVQRIYPGAAGRYFVIPNAASAEFRVLPPGENRHPDVPTDPFILYVGNRPGYKNFSDFVAAFSQWEGRDKYMLVVVGAPWSKLEMEVLRKFGITDRLRLMTGVDDRLLCQLYNSAGAFVYPSMYEGFGIPLLEAMACGCPIVASRIPSTVEVAGESPFYFDLAQPDELLHALDRACQETRLSRHIKMGLEKASQYSWDRTARDTLEVYRCLYSQE